jgi:hypothetical protein
MGAKSYCLVTAVIFGAVALLHLLRAVYRWPVIVEAWRVPLWVSWLAIPVAAALCIWGFWMGSLEGGPREGPGEGIPTLE